MTMQWVLFSVFILIFLATATITLLGLIQKVEIKEGFLKGLYAALILEVVGVLIGLGHSSAFFEDPLNDFLTKLPTQIKSKSVDEAIEKINILVNRPLICNDCDEKISSILSKLPNDIQRATPEETIITVNKKLETFDLEIISLSSFYSSLPIEVQSNNPTGIKNKIQSLLNKYNDSSSQLENISSELESCQDKINTGGVKGRGLLPKLMVLQSDISRFDNINFEWRPNEKREIAFRVLEVMGELGHYTRTAELDPSEAHKAVILYQTKKQIKPANGRFGRQTLLQLFNDFLHLE